MQKNKIIKKWFLFILILSVLLPSNAENTSAATKTAYVDITSGTLSIKSGPGLKYKKIGELQKHAKITVYSTTKSGWSEVRYNKKKAYVSSKYLINVNIGKSRFTYTFKDVNDKKYTVYVIGSNETKKKASVDEGTVWAGANEGDTLYNGDYKIYLRKNGSHTATYTKYQYKNYTYNKSKKMIYSIPAKYKGQPDILAIAETWSSNFQAADLFFVKSGKLKKIKNDLAYTSRPRNVAKNTLQTKSYDNSVGRWYSYNHTINLEKATLITKQVK